ncbi:hypothetical protein HanHA300_Chr11g0410051 [Helianthus annuus]|nr:hypothetical protein HanHA300_Chr11g0410051 [Helianthus annuus]KAJ0518119.1 hypothetical protein HanHA89_Chr11g0433741 [Helianthus annuus]KAJ0686144.1 hypothetical protein HanLR1_Chr11g0411331 [Helianthus annuus]
MSKVGIESVPKMSKVGIESVPKMYPCTRFGKFGTGYHLLISLLKTKQTNRRNLHEIDQNIHHEL